MTLGRQHRAGPVKSQLQVSDSLLKGSSSRYSTLDVSGTTPGPDDSPENIPSLAELPYFWVASEMEMRLLKNNNSASHVG